MHMTSHGAAHVTHALFNIRTVRNKARQATLQLRAAMQRKSGWAGRAQAKRSQHVAPLYIRRARRRCRRPLQAPVGARRLQPGAKRFQYLLFY